MIPGPGHVPWLQVPSPEGAEGNQLMFFLSLSHYPLHSFLKIKIKINGKKHPQMRINKQKQNEGF